MRGLIIEGVTASGKSTMLAALQASMAREVPGATKLFLSEHYTERLFEDAVKQSDAIAPDILRHARAVCAQLSQLHELQASGKFRARGGNSEIYALLERFLGAHFANLRMYSRSVALSGFVAESHSIYRELAAIGVRVALIAPDRDYLRLAVMDTRERRNPQWRAFLDRLGSDEATLASHFRAWQCELQQFYDTVQRVIPIDVYPVRSRDDLHGAVPRMLDSLCR